MTRTRALRLSLSLRRVLDRLTREPVTAQRQEAIARLLESVHDGERDGAWPPMQLEFRFPMSDRDGDARER